MALCLLTLACGLAEPDQGATERLDAPEPKFQMNVVEHARAQIEPRLDWRSSAIERAPMSLTTGDGSGLRLVSVTGTVVIEDPLAFCELHMTFENTESRRREGRFEIDLPPGAALSRLAMQIGQRWMEGEVVELERGRETFESYIHFRPKVDPALLEQAAANRVSARVFPILPRERKEIVVSYSQPLATSDHSYRLPLRGLPELDALDLRVLVNVSGTTSGQRVLEVHERRFAPTHDLVVALDGAGEAGALRSGELVALRVRPALAREPATPGADDLLDGLTVLFDTSASTAHGFDREIDRLGAALESLGDAPVRLLAFDQSVELIHDGPAREALGPALAALRERRAFGASDLHGALGHELLRAATNRRLLIWSDGVATAGVLEREALAEAARSLGLARVDAYASATSADRELLSAITSAGEHGGVVAGPDLDGPAILTALGRPGLDGVSVGVEGASWSWPRTLDGVAPGDDVVVFARFDDGAPAQIQVGFSDERILAHVIPTIEGAAPLLERAAARARVDELQLALERSSDDEEAARLRGQLVELAIDKRLLTKHTALIVLESGAEYQRHGIRQVSRSNILGVGADGVELRERGRGPSRESSVSPMMIDALTSETGEASIVGIEAQQWGVSADASSLGLVGTGRGGGGTGEGLIGLGGIIGLGGSGTGAGYGRGSGAGFGGRGMRIPRVRQAKAMVQGSLDKDIIRRIVRAHINEVRSCYNRGLVRDPNLGGRVDIRFVIMPNGSVGSSKVASSSLPNAAVSDCIAKAARRWRFPHPPGGGAVGVVYPFRLDPGGSTLPRSLRRRPGDPSNAHAAKWAGSAQTGRFGELLQLAAAGQADRARADAWAWATSEPDNDLALIALGQMLTRAGELELAARVYGSLIDLHPHRAEIRRAAGARLDAVGAPGRALAIDSYRKAIEQRPDQINGHRLLAWALVKDGELEQAFEVLSEAIDTPIPARRFAGVKKLLRQDRELIAAAVLGGADRLDPAFAERLREEGVEPATRPSLRLVASWETDATDVDILVDTLGSGDGTRHADVRTGYGPEAWISDPGKRPVAVSARVRYFNRGAMGHALGTVSAIDHDGAGNLVFYERPFVLMRGEGSVDLGRIGG